MATLSGPRAGLEDGPEGGFVVQRAEGALRSAAVARLLGVRGPGRETERFQEQARLEGNDLSLFWAAVRGGVVTQSAMAVCGAGRTAMVFLSPDGAGAGLPTRRAVESALEERSALLVRAAEELQGVTLAQGLLEPQEDDLARAYESAGYKRLATLDYLRRDLPRRWSGIGPTWPPGVVVRSLAEIGQPRADEQLAASLAVSYEQTMDCPGLCGLRSVADVIESHRAVGQYDPRLWWIVEVDGEPAGCMLLSPCEAQGTVELVYLGIGPKVRGKGLGRRLLDHAVWKLSGRKETYLACAVDQGNTPALRLYRASKFRVFASRVAFVRPLV